MEAMRQPHRRIQVMLAALGEAREPRTPQPRIPALRGDAPPGYAYPLDRHPVVLYLLHLGTGSRENILRRLRIAAELLSRRRHNAWSFPWHGLEYPHLMALRHKLATAHAPQTVNLTLYAVKGALKQGWRLDYVSLQDYLRLCEVPPVKGQRVPPGRALDPAEVAALFRACATDPRHVLAAREAAILGLLFGLGLRRGEAIALDLGDYDPAAGTLRIRHGKGDKERLAYPNSDIATALAAWLVYRGSLQGPLLTQIVLSGRVKPVRLTTRGLNLILRKRAAQAGVAHVIPHDLRCTFISTMLDVGEDVLTVSRLAGHTQVETTRLYDRRGAKAEQAAMQRFSVPYMVPGVGDPRPHGG
jgi:integrase/recombinase XerD